MPSNMKLDICETSHGIRATVSPVTLTPAGQAWVTHNNDIWMYNSSGYLVRVHKRTRKALYTPDTQCPVPEEQLQENNSIQARWNTRGLWGQVQRPSTTTKEQKTPRTSMVRRNMVQGQRDNKTSSTTVAKGTSSGSSANTSNTESISS